MYREIEERVENARADLASAYDSFDYATGFDIDAAIYNICAKEITFQNALRDVKKELAKIPTLKTPNTTVTQKLMNYFTPKEKKSQRRTA